MTASESSAGLPDDFAGNRELTTAQPGSARSEAESIGPDHSGTGPHRSYPCTMDRLSELLSGAASAVRRLYRGPSRPQPPGGRQDPLTASGAPAAHPPGAGASSPGRSGRDATVEIDPRDIGRVWMTYSPRTDGRPDPGEVVWTWVPYEENDGRGKDRPVLLVAVEQSGTLLGVQLTSKRHNGADFLPVGAGEWDGEHRPSWAKIDRIIRMHPGGMRREGTALPRREFTAVAAKLARRYSWTPITD